MTLLNLSRGWLDMMGIGMVSVIGIFVVHSSLLVGIVGLDIVAVVFDIAADNSAFNDKDNVVDDFVDLILIEGKLSERTN